MAFQQGLSGLNTAAKALDVVSNNIANAATVGYKGASAQFADVYAASLGIGSASQVGIGASLATVQQQFTQGNISNSNNPLDIAINGNGFFRLQKSATDQTITYTRNGQYHLDDEGFIVNAMNNNLTGYPIENGVTNRAQLVPVQLDTTGVVPRATGTATSNNGVVTQINLDDRDLKSLTSASPNILSAWSANTSFPPNNLNTFNYSTSVTIYDQKGNDHSLSMYFTRVENSEGTTVGKNLWEVHFVLDDQDVTGNVLAATSGGTGVPTLEFGADGNIVTTGFSSTAGLSNSDTLSADATNGNTLTFVPASASVVVTNADGSVTYTEDTGFGGDYAIDYTTGEITFPAGTTITDGQGIVVSYTTGAAAMASDYQFNLDVASLATDFPQFANLFPADIPLNFDNSTLFGSGYDVNKLVQDGYPYGRLSGVSVSSNGVLRGSYSNGQTKDIAQVALVDFISPTGLVSVGNNQWAETAASGQPLVGDPGSGNRGLLQASSVEDANVDLTQELVNMITYQRNYQANAQSIKTQDQIMQTLVNLR
jgi:flagellar hook protein FlgE